MARGDEEALLIRDRENAAEIHDGDAVADVLREAKVVADEQVGEPRASCGFSIRFGTPASSWLD